MSLIWSNCCQDDPCKPDCVVLRRQDINYRADFERLFQPEEAYQAGSVTDTDQDGLPDGIDRPYTFSAGKMTLSYTSSLDTFIQDSIVDNIGFYLPIDISWSNEDQEYNETFTITLGNLVINGETTGTYTYNTQHCDYNTSIYANGNKIYYSSAKGVSVPGIGYGSIITRIPHFIIRYNNRVYYIIDDKSVYEGIDSSGLTGEVHIDYSFISEVVIDENNSSPAQTTITFGSEGTSAQRKYPIIWRPDKWQYFQEFQTFPDISSTSDQTLEDITDVYQNDRSERDGCLQPSIVGMVEKGVTFPNCFPPVGVKFYGFKNSSNKVIPGRITYDSSGQYPAYANADINTAAQTQFQGMTGTNRTLRWANGATVSFDYDAVVGIIFNAVSGDENTITFEPMNPVDVMVNNQAYYGVEQDSYSPAMTLKGFFTSHKNVLSDDVLVQDFISTDFKNCRANPYETFEYGWKEDGSYSENSIPTYYGARVGETDNGFQLKDITLTVFKGVVAPTIHVSIASRGTFNFVFETCEPYLAQEDIDNWNNDQWPRLVELKRAGIVDSVVTTGPVIGVTTTSTVFDANFSSFTIDSSKRDNRPVIFLQYADLVGNQTDKYFKYKVTDKYGAESEGTVYIHFDPSAPHEVTQFFESYEGSTLTGLDYDLVCKLTATPSMYTASPNVNDTTGNLIELYYVHPEKQLEAKDLVDTLTPNQAKYYSFQNKIVHNFPLNRDITYPKWISWGGVLQDEIYAEFVSPDNHILAKNRYALYSDYTSSGVPHPLIVEYCVLSVSMYSGTEDDNKYITWVPLNIVVGVTLNPDPVEEEECSFIDNNPTYRGVGHFLIYTDVSTGDETYVDVPFAYSPLLPYSAIIPMSGGYWYERITKISDSTVPVIIGIRIDGITVHYTNGTQETVLLSNWNSTGDAYIK